MVKLNLLGNTREENGVIFLWYKYDFMINNGIYENVF